MAAKGKRAKEPGQAPRSGQGRAEWRPEPKGKVRSQETEGKAATSVTFSMKTRDSGQRLPGPDRAHHSQHM